MSCSIAADSQPLDPHRLIAGLFIYQLEINYIRPVDRNTSQLILIITISTLYTLYAALYLPAVQSENSAALLQFCHKRGTATVMYQDQLGLLVRFAAELHYSCLRWLRPALCPPSGDRSILRPVNITSWGRPAHWPVVATPAGGRRQETYQQQRKAIHLSLNIDIDVQTCSIQPQSASPPPRKFHISSKRKTFSLASSGIFTSLQILKFSLPSCLTCRLSILLPRPGGF